MKVIVFSNQKGGVGKTTTTRELGIYLSTTLKAGLADEYYKVLFIDSDPQANLSKSLVDVPGFGLYEALTGGDFEPETVKPNIFLLSGGVKLAGLEKALIGELDAFTRLRELLDGEQFQILVERRLRHDGGDAFRNHALARAGAADHQQIVAARDGDLHGAAEGLLAFHFGEIHGVA